MKKWLMPFIAFLGIAGLWSSAAHASAVNTATTLVITPNPSIAGQLVIIKATVIASNGAIPTGNVIFTFDRVLAPVQTLDAAGAATYTTATNLAFGYHTATAEYVGVTGSFNPSFAQISFGHTPPVCTKVPTVITNAESLLTSSSVKLNGRVTPNGCPTTVYFDFGYNNAYGLEVAAIPSSIPGADGVTPVGRSKTGLECGTEYHYRTVATNAAGTIYGADRMFKAPDCVLTDADAWLYKPNPIVLIGHAFTQDIHINTKGEVVAIYDFTLNFDNTKVIVDTRYQNAAGTCDQGVCPGEFALSEPMVVVDNNVGEIRLVAFDENGTGPSNDLQVVQIHFIASNSPGLFPIGLTVNDLSDQFGDPVGNQVGRGSNVAISFGICGDVDGNGVVNIVDVLSVARKMVNLPPPPTINVLLADVDQNGRVTITDLMCIWRYCIGLPIGAIHACAIGMPLPPNLSSD